MKPLLVALHEIRIYLQDKADLAFSLLLPIAIFALMYGAFSGQSLFHGTAYVVNQDEGKTYSRDFIKRLKKLDNLDVEILSVSEADSKLDRSDLLMVIFIPEGKQNWFSNKEETGVRRTRSWPAWCVVWQRE